MIHPLFACFLQFGFRLAKVTSHSLFPRLRFHWMAPGVLLDWRHCGVDLVVILHDEIDIGREFHGLRERFQF